MKSKNFEIKECSLYHRGNILVEGAERITELWADVQVNTPTICKGMSEGLLDELSDFLDTTIVKGICKPRRL